MLYVLGGGPIADLVDRALDKIEAKHALREAHGEQTMPTKTPEESSFSGPKVKVQRSNQRSSVPSTPRVSTSETTTSGQDATIAVSN